MQTSYETIYHFTCEKCNMWWSIALSFNSDKLNSEKLLIRKYWWCPWCGHRHILKKN